MYGICGIRYAVPRTDKFFLETELDWGSPCGDGEIEEIDDTDIDIEETDSAIAVSTEDVYSSRPAREQCLYQNVTPIEKRAIEITVTKKFKDQSTQTIVASASACTQTEVNDESESPKSIPVESKAKTKKSKKKAIKGKGENTHSNEKGDFTEDDELRMILNICRRRSQCASRNDSGNIKSVYDISSALSMNISCHEYPTLLISDEIFEPSMIQENSVFKRRNGAFEIELERIEDICDDDIFQNYTLKGQRIDEIDDMLDGFSQNDDVYFTGSSDSDVSSLYLTDSSMVSEAPQSFITSIQHLKQNVLINERIDVAKFRWNTLLLVGAEPTFQCAVCSEEVDGRWALRHMELESHRRRLDEAPPLEKYGENLIRQLNETSMHCAICNKIFSDAPAHISGNLHALQYSWALESGSQIRSKNKETLAQVKNVASNGTKKPDNTNDGKSGILDVRVDTKGSKTTGFNVEDKLTPTIKTNATVTNTAANKQKTIPTKEVSVPVVVTALKEFSYSQVAAKRVEGDRTLSVCTVDSQRLILSSDIFHCMMACAGGWYCMACRIKIPIHMKESHKANKRHVENCSRYPWTDGLAAKMVRKLDAKCYHCIVCNQLLLENDVSHHAKLEQHKVLTEQVLTRSTPKQIEIQERTDRENAEAIRSTLSKAYAEGDIVPDKTAPDVKVFLNAGGVKLSVDRLAWLGVVCTVDYHRCALCAELLQWAMLDEHFGSAKHVSRMRDTTFLAKYGEHLIRQVTSTEVHCTVCNKVVPSNESNMVAHTNGTPHTQKLQLAKNQAAANNAKKVNAVVMKPPGNTSGAANLTAVTDDRASVTPALADDRASVIPALADDRASVTPALADDRTRVTPALADDRASVTPALRPDSIRKMQLVNSSTGKIHNPNSPVDSSAAIIPSAGKVNKKSAAAIVIEDHVIVNLRGGKIALRRNAWEGISDVPHCYLCVEAVKSVGAHRASSRHKLAVAGARMLESCPEHLMRELPSKILHCVTCNVVVQPQDVKFHIRKEKHNQHLKEARKLFHDLTDLSPRGASLVNSLEHVEITTTGKDMSEDKEIANKPVKSEVKDIKDNSNRLLNAILTVDNKEKSTNNAQKETQKIETAKPNHEFIGILEELEDVEEKIERKRKVEEKKKKFEAACEKQEIFQQYLITFCGRSVMLSANAWFGVREKTSGVFGCWFCGRDVQGKDLAAHKLSTRHHVEMMDARMLEDSTRDFIRELSSKLVNCMVCNDLLPSSELPQHTDGPSHRHNLKLCQASDKPLTSQTSIVNLDMLIANSKRVQSHYCILYNPELSRSVVVSADAWHGLQRLKKVRCQVCATKSVISDVEGHISSSGHCANLRRRHLLDSYPGHFLRTLDNICHCLTCDTVVQAVDIERHIEKEKHNALLDEARNKVSSTTTSVMVNFSKYSGPKEPNVATRSRSDNVPGTSLKKEILDDELCRNVVNTIERAFSSDSLKELGEIVGKKKKRSRNK